MCVYNGFHCCGVARGVDDCADEFLTFPPMFVVCSFALSTRALTFSPLADYYYNYIIRYPVSAMCATM